MLTITRLFVRSMNLDHLDLFWEIGPVPGPEVDSAPHEIYDYEFYVLRSEAGMGPYDQIGGPFRDTYHFRDIGVSLIHKWRQYHYKLRVVHRRTGEAAEFGPTSSHDPEPDLIAAEIIRQEDLLLREFVGRKCWLYPIRTFGPMCSCFDITLQRKTRGAHPVCFGTGWLGGYMSPVEIYVQIDPSPKQTQVQQLQEGQVATTTGRTSSFPLIAPRDILIETENRRWRVVNVTTTQRLRATVRQELALFEIPRSDIEYSIPLQVDPRTLEPASERNFTNAQNVETDEDYQDVISFWSGKPRGALQ